MQNLTNKYIITERRRPVKEHLVDIINDINKRCKPFLNEWLSAYNGKNLKIWYSGRDNKDSYYEGIIRTNRIPTSTSGKVHTDIDDYFYKEFGTRFRSNAIFVTGNLKEAMTYGKPYLIFPIGKYTFLWSDEIDDMFLYSDILSRDVSKRKNDILNSYTTDYMKDAIKSGNEIMLSGKKYIALRAMIYNDVILNWYELFGTKECTLEKIEDTWVYFLTRKRQNEI